MTGFAGTPIAFEDVKVGQSVQVTRFTEGQGSDVQDTLIESKVVHVGVVSLVGAGEFELNGWCNFFASDRHDILLLEDVAPEPLAPGHYLTTGSGYFTAVRYWDGERWRWTADGGFGFAFDPEFTVLSDRIEIKELTA